MSSLDFVGNNPGAVKYGNFINYYQFHPVKDRIEEFPTNIWCVTEGRIFTCLDVGCNSGELTQALWEFISCYAYSKSSPSEDHSVERAPRTADVDINCVILAMDLDQCLVSRAIERNPSISHISYVTCNFMDEEEVSRAVSSFHRDVIKDLRFRQTFDAVFLFSVTMWIHLNYGDAGLQKLLINAANHSKNLVVIEPQRWKCYAAANRRCLRSGGEGFSLLSELQLRGDPAIVNEINRVLSDCGFRKIDQLKESKWGRKIMFYQKCL